MATGTSAGLILFAIISIHATHTGGDARQQVRNFAVRIFQSTPPIRVATRDAVPCRLAFDISIHATHTGGDPAVAICPGRRAYFNPRHPYGWRPSSSLAIKCSGPFQSTPPIRVATRHPISMSSASVFQSTPPIRVATSRRPTVFRNYLYFNPRHPYGWRHWAYMSAHCMFGISIHATHTGGDIPDRTSFEQEMISIHATHTGGDRIPAAGQGAC